MSDSNGQLVQESIAVSAPAEDEVVEARKTYHIPIKLIRRFVDQPRKYFDPAALQDLARSLKGGQTTPITVIRIEDDPDHKFELDDGERRWRAAKIAQLPTLEAMIVHFHSKDAQFVDSMISNLQREGYTPLEVAEGLAKLLKIKMTREAIAERCGYSVGWVNQHLSLLKLAPEVQALMDPERSIEQRLPYQLALKLASLSHNPKLQTKLAERCVKKKIPLKTAALMITALARQAGEKLPNREPSRDFRVLRSYINRIEEESAAILQLQEDSYTRMLGSRTDADVRILTGRLENARANLQRLIERLQSAKQAVNDRVTLG